MRKGRIKILSHKYVIACHIKINKWTKTILPSKITWLNILSLLINVVLTCQWDEWACFIFIFFFLILRTPNMSSLTPGVRVTQVEYHCFRQWWLKKHIYLLTNNDYK
jgi:hypothetical protein